MTKKHARHSRLRKSRRLEDLVKIMEILLSEKGCPWDREQTHRTLIKYLHEEAGEVADAVRKKDWENLKEELGDVLLQVVFHSALAAKAGRFDLGDVIKNINSKLVRRHPHVFGDKSFKTPAEVLVEWNKIKKTEKAPKARGRK
jgi:MazG family protein